LCADCSVATDVIAWASFTTAWWPLKSLQAWARERRARSTALLFLGMSYVTHLTWELGWLLLHERIEAARRLVGLPPWVVVPPLVLWWGAGTLGHRRPSSS